MRNILRKNIWKYKPGDFKDTGKGHLKKRRD